MIIPTGNYGRLAFYYETDLEQTDTSNVYSFGYGAKLSGVNTGRRVEEIYNIGSPFPKTMAALRFEGTVGVDAILTDDSLFEFIFGQGSKNGVDSDADGVVDYYEYSLQPKPQSITIEYGYIGNPNTLIQLKGTLPRSVSISARVNQPITYKLSCVFTKPVKSNPDTIDPVDPDVTGIPTFVDAQLSFMGQSGIIVQDFSIDMDLGSELVYGLGSAFPLGMYRGKIAISGKARVLADSDTMYDLLYSLGFNSDGMSEPIDGTSNPNLSNSATLTIGIDTNGDGSADRSFEFDVSGVVIEKIGQDLEVGEMVMYDVDFKAMLVSAKYTP